jgi:N-acetylmuramoyl-L-alanine amidase
MGTGIYNVKLYTNNIFKFKLFVLSLIILMLPGISCAFENEKKWVIVIDAGHGGRDPGALGSYSKEKNITLPIALKTGEYIEKNISNAQVLYTRKNDVFMDIWERAEFANKNKADLFVSIHVNWAEYKSIHGTETFVMGLAKDQENLEVAMKENEVILLEDDYTTKYEGFDPKSPESYIMFTLIQNIYLSQSTDLASKMQSQYKERVNRTDRGVKQAGFVVLFMTTMPSVLTEIGFITNAAEEKFLNSNQGQDYIASAIFRACRDYMTEIDKKSGISAVRNQSSNPSGDNPTATTGNAGEVSYKVQIATSSAPKELKSENFTGLKDVTEIKDDDRYKYTTGNFKDYTEAVIYRKTIATIYPDAFVIAVKGNKIVPLQEALEQNEKK